jgi:hypothetical protein
MQGNTATGVVIDDPILAPQPVMNRKTRRAFVALFRRKKLRLMAPHVSRTELAVMRSFFPERY